VPHRAAFDQAGALTGDISLLDSPAFGQADLTNCERELIHLAGSVQPHGVLLVLDEAARTVQQASGNSEALFGAPASDLLGRPFAGFGAGAGSAIDEALAAAGDGPMPVQCRLDVAGRSIAVEGAVHRNADGVLIVELEPTEPRPGAAETADLDGETLVRQLTSAVERLSAAASIPVLADATVQCIRDLTGYDRVMVYRFDPDGHGKVISEARHPRLEPLLGHHYPASDIPQRARELYLRNRVRVLVDVHYTPAPLLPQVLPANGGELDMSLSYLRSMSPLHLQYLKNMGVTATLVASLVREGRLWGLIACHHYAPRNLRLALRSACGMLAEVVSTRIAAIENYAHAQVAILVRRLEQRLIEATSTEGDWRLALLRSPRHLLQPLEATGAVLAYDGEILTAGEVPSTPELRALLGWIGAQSLDGLFSCASVARANPSLAALTPTASGVLAVRLSSTRPDFLLWLRKEQLQSVTWAGDPTKPVLVANDPLQLSPRRSFAAWSEIVRGTALPWSSADLAMARAIGGALADIVVQVHAVRLLIGEHQLAQVRAAIDNSPEAVLIADAGGRALFCNEAFAALVGHGHERCAGIDAAAALFTDAQALRAALATVRSRQQAWRGELLLVRTAGEPLPVAVRLDLVPGAAAAVLGYVLTLVDLSEARRARAARQRLEESLSAAAPAGLPALSADAVVRALVANASVAAMDISDGASGTAVTPLLEELQAATRRAAELYGQVRRLARRV
jgi:chemotaxis family two-component system sensor kinase Cph1